MVEYKCVLKRVVKMNKLEEQVLYLPNEKYKMTIINKINEMIEEINTKVNKK